MAKKHDDITTKPLPSTTTPWLVILLLLCGIVVMYQCFLRPPGELWGTPLPPNEFVKYMTPPKAQPAAPPTSAPADAPAATPDAAPAQPSLDSGRVIGE